MNIILSVVIRWCLLVFVSVVVSVLLNVAGRELIEINSVAVASSIEETSSIVLFLCYVGVTAIEVAIIMFLRTRFRINGLALVMLLVAIFWGTKVLQMMIEAAFFLNYWMDKPIMSIEEVIFNTIHGLFTSIIICYLVVKVMPINNDITTESLVENKTLKDEVTLVAIPYRAIFFVAVIYVPIYFIAGMFLAIPLGGESFLDTYETLQVPVWMPLFQFARGILWALILWGLVYCHQESKNSMLTGAVTFAIFSGTQLLIPNPFMGELLRMAHLVEVYVSMALFGWLGAKVLIKARGINASQIINKPSTLK